MRQRGLSVALLEAGREPIGSWPQYYDSLTLFAPAKYNSLPGLPFPGDPDRDDVIDCLRQYAKTLDADLQTGQHVDTVTHDGQLFTGHTNTGTAFTAPRLVAATGGFGSPNIPALPGQDSFTGTIVHASQYRSPAEYTGQRVIVVGAGNSAVQIAAELAEQATVTLASRTPVKFVPQRPLGRDMHFWFITITGIDTLPVGHLLRHPPTAPVLDTGRYQSALTAHQPEPRPMFATLDTDTAIWPDDNNIEVDTIILATGYTPNLHYLSGIGALTTSGQPLHNKGLSTTHHGLGYVGLEWQRSLPSGSLRGVGRDARRVAANLQNLTVAS
ncbi:NAD(P)/FAD-dependent oxidoreductase [Nocardia vinacea]|nr:NAD(P)/FAD-dependent oxidoreductase [Nocardia vinacea]